METPNALLIDLDGVLYVEDAPVDGALEALTELRDAGIPMRFVTNTTARSRSEILDRLERLGYEIDSDELLTPASLAVARCRAEGYDRVALLVADALREDLAELDSSDDDVQAVVLGDLGHDFDWDLLNRALGLLRGGAELIALQKNRVWQTGEGLALDLGPFVAALEYASDRTATVVGKPSEQFFALALEDLGVEAGEAAMVGDDIEADVGGAIDAGIAGILVKTGKYRDDTAEGSDVEPTAVVDSFSEVPRLLGATTT